MNEEKLYTRKDLEDAITFGSDLEFGNVERDFKKYSTCVDQFIDTVVNKPKEDTHE